MPRDAADLNMPLEHDRDDLHRLPRVRLDARLRVLADADMGDWKSHTEGRRS